MSILHTDSTTNRSAFLSSTHRFNPSNLFALHSHTKLKLTAAFICAGLLIAAGADLAANDNPSVKSSSTTSSQGANMSISNDNPDNSPTTPAVTDPVTDSSTSSGTSTNISSSTVNGEASTKVTVNGQNVPVPENGSTSKTVTNDNGSTTVHISGSHSSVGNATNRTSTRTSLNVSSSTNTQEGN